MKNYLISASIALAVSMGVIWVAPQVLDMGQKVTVEHVNGQHTPGAVLTVNDKNEIVPLDFTEVSAEVMDAVVHIKSTQAVSARSSQMRQLPDPFRQFFNLPQGGQPMAPQPKVGTGSGVIINGDGYIVTNNHVIADASDIEVTLHDNRTYKASVIGTDPTTDLALIQIEEKGLPSVPMVDSDQVRVGEWVLAVGNPFNLNSTVTAGIVSAKSRSINILRDQYAVESFIQTDAAINPGNSGGALVNLQGALIGVNTAIASPTGSYAGYGFAVPSNIVNKVVEDLLKYGRVQRGFLGVRIIGVDGNLAKEKDLNVNKGVYVAEVGEEGAAGEAGVEAGDVIVKVDGDEVDTPAQLQEMIARHRPGDKVNLTIIRDGDTELIAVALKNKEGGTDFLENTNTKVFSALGATFENLDRKTAKKLGLNGGVRVSALHPGKFSRDTNMEEGFIITKVGGRVIKNMEDLASAIEGKTGGILIEGRYEDSEEVYYYAIGM